MATSETKAFYSTFRFTLLNCIDHEREWQPPCEVVFGLATNTLDVYIYIYFIYYSHHIIYCSKGMGRPGKVANPARGQLNRENDYFPAPVVCA